jgi:DNA-binding winged helix-turn-helix (wHTH) protein
MAWTIGELVLDDEKWQLRSPLGPRHVRKQVLELLYYLARHSERVVPREELLREVWGVRVGQDALNQCVRCARAALGPWASRLRTVRGCGYQLVLDGARPAQHAELIPSDIEASPGVVALGSAPHDLVRLHTERLYRDALALATRLGLPETLHQRVLSSLGAALYRAAREHGAIDGQHLEHAGFGELKSAEPAGAEA